MTFASSLRKNKKKKEQKMEIANIVLREKGSE